jgi:uncharacterized OsmC-like protein
MAVSMSARYAGDLHCELEHGPSRSRIETDAPKDNLGKGAAFSPTDLVGAALLSCAITTMAIKARKAGFELGVSEGKVEKHMTTEPPRRIARLVLELEVDGEYSNEQKLELQDYAETCPVALSLGDEVQVDMVIRFLR